MRRNALRPQFVEFIPEQLEDGILYASQRYRTATHLCCCGCGSEVVTPLGPADWTMEVVNGAVTLRPSIGNWSLPCRSHYLIRKGRVIWALDMARAEIHRGRRRDQRLRDAHIAEINRLKEAAGDQAPPAVPSPTSWIAGQWRALLGWLGLSN